MQGQHALTRTAYERELDAAIAGSFPASDPPPWTLGASSWMEWQTPAVPAPVPAAVDVVIADRTSGLTTLVEVVAMAALVPIGILIVGLPVAALAWGVANVF